VHYNIQIVVQSVDHVDEQLDTYGKVKVAKKHSVKEERINLTGESRDRVFEKAKAALDVLL
jgi:hypothetical protein